MADAVKPRRPYRSERREEQARRTRAAVLDAATRLFVADGYGATTLQAIADEAQVSVQSVYAIFGNKRQLLELALDVAIAGDDEPVAVNDRDWMHDVFHHPDPVARLTAYAAACRRIQARAADVFAAVQAAAAVDPDLRPLAEAADDRRRAGARSIVAGLAAISALRPDIDEDAAADVLWTLNSPEVFQLLVRRAGWDLDRFEAWLAESLQAQLLAPTPRPRARSGQRTTR